MAQEIGFVGLGKMGAPMVRALAAAGFGVAGFDVDPARREALRDVSRLTLVDDLSSAARPMTVLMLPDGEIVREVLCALAPGLPRGGLVIDMSSADPVVYADLAEMLAKRDVALIDAPVSGSVSGAEAGTLTIMAGGAAADVARAGPVLEAMGKTIFHTGALGSGQVMKSLNNLLSAGGLIMAIEVLMVAKKAGLDPSQVTEILNVSTGRNNSTERKIAPYVLSGAYDSGFDLSLMAKDLRTAGAVAARAGVDLPLGAYAIAAANAADADLGAGADHTEVARWLARLTGVVL